MYMGRVYYSDDTEECRKYPDLLPSQSYKLVCDFGEQAFNSSKKVRVFIISMWASPNFWENQDWCRSLDDLQLCRQRLDRIYNNEKEGV